MHLVCTAFSYASASTGAQQLEQSVLSTHQHSKPSMSQNLLCQKVVLCQTRGCRLYKSCWRSASPDTKACRRRYVGKRCGMKRETQDETAAQVQSNEGISGRRSGARGSTVQKGLVAGEETRKKSGRIASPENCSVNNSSPFLSFLRSLCLSSI